MSEVVLKEYRGGYLDTVINADIAIVSRNGLEFSVGNPYKQAFYRSAIKPIQTMPFITLGLHKKYNFTDEEIAIMGASHVGEPVHISVVNCMLTKTGFSENDMVMGKTYPHSKAEMKKLASAQMPKRRIYHNCSGKHIGMLCISKELEEPPSQYRYIDSKMGQLSLEYVRSFSEYKDVLTAIDGCGVPIFMVPLYNMALSYLKLANPTTIDDIHISKSSEIVFNAFHKHSYIIRGHNTLCEKINSDHNLIGKLGAGGVYCIGIKEPQLGIAIKTEDGNLEHMPMIVKQILEKIGYNINLESIIDRNVYNDAKEIVGHREAIISLKTNLTNMSF